MKDFLIQWKDAAPAVGVLIALVSAAVALTVLFYTRGANRRRATLDMVMKTLLDDYAQKCQIAFRAVVLKNEDTSDPFKMESLIADEARGSADRKAVLHQLNVYELMALGIKRGIFDEAFYKRWYHNQFMSDYESSIVFIKGMQDRKSTVFCEISTLYGKWLKHGHPDGSPGRWKMAWWAFRKQDHKIDEARANARARG